MIYYGETTVYDILMQRQIHFGSPQKKIQILQAIHDTIWLMQDKQCAHLREELNRLTHWLHEVDPGLDLFRLVVEKRDEQQLMLAVTKVSFQASTKQQKALEQTVYQTQPF